jgi:hypothetical protein
MSTGMPSVTGERWGALTLVPFAPAVRQPVRWFGALQLQGQRRNLSRLVAIVALLAGPVAAAAADRAPDWLKAVQSVPATASRKEDTAVVLLEDGQLEVSANGNLTTRMRQVVRVLTAEGSKHARARVLYNTDSTKIKSFQAWLIAPDGKVTAFGKKRIIDASVTTARGQLYGEERQQQISAVEEAKPGAIFAYESVVERTTVVAQEILRYGSALPVEHDVFTIQLPAGWRLNAQPFNGAPAGTEVTGSQYRWTMTAIPAMASEPLAAPPSTFMPWVGIDLVPPAGSQVAATRLALASWKDLSTYLSPRYEAAAAADATMKAKADELVRGKTNLLSRLQALGGYAQEVTYISIQLDDSHAGGLIPRPATRVFHNNYGDCKDKATMLRGLLATQGITSYPLIVQSGLATRVEENWPSAKQFNHAILAIQVDDSVDSPAVFTHPELGRLLVFDPTNEVTPIGSLADTLLADKGVLLAGARGGLVTLPAENPESNRMERRVRAALDDLGGITGTIEEEFFGQASASARGERRRNGEAEFRRRIERWLAGTLPAAQNSRVETADFWAENRFTMTTDFASAKYGKLMRDELIVFKPILVARRGAVALRKGTGPRTQPLHLRPSRFKERTEITLPPGCTVEETISPVSLTTAFGSYQATCTMQEGKLIFERSLEQQAVELPAGEFEAVRAFFDKIVQTEQSPVVLRRKRLAQAAP